MRTQGYYWILLKKNDCQPKWVASEWVYNHWTGIDDLHRKGYHVSYVDETRILNPEERHRNEIFANVDMDKIKPIS